MSEVTNALDDFVTLHPELAQYEDALHTLCWECYDIGYDVGYEDGEQEAKEDGDYREDWD